jgi:2-C-methyl-D-erythritol 2,4-cyclodiphosphate synthase
MPMTSLTCHRTGFGFDSHLFGETGTLILGGVKFPKTPALRGHSDGDAVLHAVIDALLGAAALGDIGDLFPDTAKKFKGADSRRLLETALKKVRHAGWMPAHVDITVLADSPRLGSSKQKMKSGIARSLGLKPAAVSIKAKTQEGLKLFIHPGGIAVWAIATLINSHG